LLHEIRDHPALIAVESCRPVRGLRTKARLANELNRDAGKIEMFFMRAQVNLNRREQPLPAGLRPRQVRHRASVGVELVLRNIEEQCFLAGEVRSRSMSSGQ
jgi:hypothetical protein